MLYCTWDFQPCQTQADQLYIKAIQISSRLEILDLEIEVEQLTTTARLCIRQLEFFCTKVLKISKLTDIIPLCLLPNIVDKVGVDKMGVDKVGVDKMRSRQSMGINSLTVYAQLNFTAAKSMTNMQI